MDGDLVIKHVCDKLSINYKHVQIKTSSIKNTKKIPWKESTDSILRVNLIFNDSTVASMGIREPNVPTIDMYITKPKQTENKHNKHGSYSTATS